MVIHKFRSLKNLEFKFLTITPRATLVLLVRVPPRGQNEMFCHSLKIINSYLKPSVYIYILLYTHNNNKYAYIRTYTCRIYIDTIVKTSEDFFQKSIPFSLLKGLCVWGSWRLNKDCNILTSPAPQVIAVCRSRSPGLLNRRTSGPLRWVLFSLPHLVSNWLVSKN